MPESPNHRNLPLAAINKTPPDWHSGHAHFTHQCACQITHRLHQKIKSSLCAPLCRTIWPSSIPLRQCIWTRSSINPRDKHRVQYICQVRPQSGFYLCLAGYKTMPVTQVHSPCQPPNLSAPLAHGLTSLAYPICCRVCGCSTRSPHSGKVSCTGKSAPRFGLLILPIKNSSTYSSAITSRPLRRGSPGKGGSRLGIFSLNNQWSLQK